MSRRPYVDLAVRRLSAGDSEYERALGNNMHWGAWERPEDADTSADGFAAATERLTAMLLERARIADGIRVLDAGCGLGGTIETLDRELRGASLTGIDVDPGPLALARRRVAGTGENSIEFVEGDATRTRFPSAGFDRVLATESLLYMSRLRFLREAARLLDEAGRLVAAEFLLAGPSVPRRLPVLLTESRHLGFIGRSHVPITVGAYRALARFAGLVLVGAEDITASTLPTYEALRAVIDEQGWPDSANRAIDAIERMSTTGIVRYTLLTFEPRRRRR